MIASSNAFVHACLASLPPTSFLLMVYPRAGSSHATHIGQRPARAFGARSGTSVNAPRLSMFCTKFQKNRCKWALSVHRVFRSSIGQTVACTGRSLATTFKACAWNKCVRYHRGVLELSINCYYGGSRTYKALLRFFRDFVWPHTYPFIAFQAHLRRRIRPT